MSAVVTWEPRSATDLTRRMQRVRESNDQKVDPEVVFAGAATVVVPVLVFTGSPLNLTSRLVGAAVAALVFFLLFNFLRRGLYLSQDGVRIWRAIWPRPTIPWEQVAGFEIEQVSVDLGRKRGERIAVRTTAGEVHSCWFHFRYSDFEQRPLPVESRKAVLPLCVRVQ